MKGLISNSDLGRANSASCYRKGRQFLLTFFDMSTRWTRSTSNFYALIGQNLSGEFKRKIYTASGNFFTDSWSLQSFVLSSCDVFLTVFFHWVYKMKYSCYPSVIHGWFVYWVFGWEMRRACPSHRKSNFGWHHFRLSPCFMRKRVQKAQAILAILDGFQELHLYW